jgi:hypothetical protein
MISYKITTTIIGFAIFLTILILVRRGKLQEKQSLAWLGIGILMMVLGIFPRIIDKIGHYLGVQYGPSLLFVVAIGILFIQNLYHSISASSYEMRIRELSQQVAVLNKMIRELLDKEQRREGPSPEKAPPPPPV